MFKKLAIAIALVAGLSVAATVAFAKKVDPPAKICLNRGSYLLVFTNDAVYRIKMDAGRMVDEKRLPITVSGVSFGKFAVNACDLVFTREKPGQLPDLYHMNPSTGWEQQNITRTPDMAELQPVLEPDNGYRVAFTRYEPNGTNIVSEKLDGTMPQIEAPDAWSPAWPVNGPVSYTATKDSRIVPWGAYGLSHEYLPDRSGILVYEGFKKFTIWPFVGIPSEFGTFDLVAIRPSGSLAAVVWEDGVGNPFLAFTKLDSRWLPYGNLEFPATDIVSTDIISMAWIEVK